MIKVLKSLVVLLMVAGCSKDPSTFKVPVPDKEFVDKSGTVSGYNPEVDILFIIDDSGSMSSYQNRLAENADIFMSQFFNARFIDFHIGVTTSTETDSIFGSGSKASGGKLHRVGGLTYVDRQTPDPEVILMEMLDVGTSGSGTEKFLSIPRLTFSELNLKTKNRGFYRENAHLVIFVLTDTYDQTNLEPETTYDFLVDLKKGDQSKLHYAAAIITIEKDGCSPDGSDLPIKLSKLAEYFQGRGHRFNICQSDYGKDLARVATSIVNAVSTVYLDNLPDVRTMRVFYGDKEIPNQEQGGWTYDYSLNAIHLSPEIDVQGANGDKLSIRYEEIYKAQPAD